MGDVYVIEVDDKIKICKMNPGLKLLLSIVYRNCYVLIKSYLNQLISLTHILILSMFYN